MAEANATVVKVVDSNPSGMAAEAAPAEGAALKDSKAAAATAQTNAAVPNTARCTADAAKAPEKNPCESSGPAVDTEMTNAPAEAAVSASGDAPANGAASEEASVKEPDINIEPVTIGFRTFASGNECYDYFRSLLSQLSHEQDLNEYEFTMVMDLLRKGHADPEGKIGSGVRAVQVKPHEELDSVCFFVHRTDGSKEDFSYRKCILRLFKDMKDPQSSDTVRSTRGGGRGGGRNSSGRGGGRGRGRGRGGGGRGRGRGRK